MDVLSNDLAEKQHIVIIMFEASEHIKEDVRALWEFHRILKDDGLLLLSVPYTEHVKEYDRPVGACRTRDGVDVCIGEGGSHYRNGYNLDRMKTLLMTNGFTIMNWEYLCLLKWLEASILSFPFKFPLSLVLTHFSKNRVRLKVMAPQNTIGSASIEKDWYFW